MRCYISEVSQANDLPVFIVEEAGMAVFIIPVVFGVAVDVGEDLNNDIAPQVGKDIDSSACAVFLKPLVVFLFLEHKVVIMAVFVKKAGGAVCLCFFVIGKRQIVKAYVFFKEETAGISVFIYPQEVAFFCPGKAE